MKYIIIGIIAGLLSFIVNVKAQDIDVQLRTYTKGLLCANYNNGAWTIVITIGEKFSCALIGADHSGANYDIDSTVETIQ